MPLYVAFENTRLIVFGLKSQRAETIEKFLNSTIADMVMSMIGIPLAILTVMIIKSYSLKEEKLEELEM